MQPDSLETETLLDRAGAGDGVALGHRSPTHREAVRRYIDLRFDPQTRVRVDASDILQKAHLEVVKRIQDYLACQPMPFNLWHCRTAYENLLRLRRQQVDAAGQAVGREKPLPDRSSVLLVEQVFAGSAPDRWGDGGRASRPGPGRPRQGSTRSTGRCCCCAPSRGCRTSRPRRYWGSSRRRPASGTAGHCCGCGRRWRPTGEPSPSHDPAQRRAAELVGRIADEFTDRHLRGRTAGPGVLREDVVAGGGPGGGPRMFALSGQGLMAGRRDHLANFFGGDVNNRGGIRVAVRELDGDSRADHVVGSGPGGESRVTAYVGNGVQPNGTPSELFGFDALPGFAGGAFVG